MIGSDLISIGLSPLAGTVPAGAATGSDLLSPGLGSLDGWAALPVASLSVLGMVLLIADLLLSGARRSFLGPLAGNGLIVCSLLTWLSRTSTGGGLLQGSMDQNHFTVGLSLLIMGGALLSLFLSPGYMRGGGLPRAPYYGLVIFSVAGGVLMTQAADLLTLFIGLETMSISLYLLVGLQQEDIRSPEASIKYFLMGSFASGLLLYGIAMMYGATGEIGLVQIQKNLGLNAPWLELLGMALILSGFLFKIGSVPMHMWVPDVYEGSPTPVTAYLASAVKVAAYAGLMKFLYLACYARAEYWIPFLAVIATITMIYGNVAALTQVSLKRLLAYSSIAHSGYLLVAVLSVDDATFRLMSAELTEALRTGRFDALTNFHGPQAVVFYLMAYTLTTIGAFLCLSWVGRDREHFEYIDEFRGLGQRHPWPAAMMALFMLSLAGIPPTAGFAAKYFAFASAVQTGHLGLAVVGVVTSLISFYYYLRVIIQMYMAEPEQEVTLTQSMPAHLSLALCAAGVLYLGIFPGCGWDLARTPILHLLRLSIP